MSTKTEEHRDDGLESLTNELKDALHMKYSDPNGPTYQSLRKLHTKCLLKAHREYEAAYNLVEALAPSVRTMAAYRSERDLYDGDPKKKLQLFSSQVSELVSKIKPTENLDASDDLLDYLHKSNDKFVQVMGTEKVEEIPESDAQPGHLDKNLVKHVSSDDEELPKFREKLKELPNEWTIIQLTAGYEPSEQWQNQKYIRSAVKEYYLTVLKNGRLVAENLDPFTVRITPDKVKYGERPLFEELHSTLEENLFVIENNIRLTDNCIKKYWEKRADCDLRMKGIISTMDKKWLGPWRCLLAGNILSKELDDKIKQHVDQACIRSRLPVTPVQKTLLYSLAGALHHTAPSEISLLIRKIYLEYSHSPGDAADSSSQPCDSCGETKKINNLCIRCEQVSISSGEEYKLFRKTFLDVMEKIKYDENTKDLKIAKRGPVVLFIDEKLDTFPWEVLPVLNSHPVTRMECLSFTYALYKAHQADIVGGQYQLRPDKGRYLINPGGDLDRMEKRMSAFIEYWCPEWKGDRSTQPPPDVFHRYLRESDIFLYCGHNDGSQYMGGGAERLRGARAVTTLSGCGSVRLRAPGTRLLPLPVHSNYHIATCPSVIGMLWEVTDLEVDKVTSMLLGLFLPSKGRPHWGDVNKAHWTQGKIDVTNTETEKFKWEPDLLRALAAARRSSAYVMIAASIVARGIPVQIHPGYQQG